MGIVGVAIVLVSAIAGCVSTWMVGELIGEFLLVYDMSDFSTTMLSEPDQALFNTMLLPPMLASAVGIAGLVLSIIAVVKNKGRAWGVTGIVLGVLAPIAMFIMYVASVAAAVSAMLGG
jgi:hypothetical protein